MKTVFQVSLIYLVMAIVLILTGCFEEFDDGYQFGDITRMTVREIKNLETARRDYCNVANGLIIRTVALGYIRSQLPMIPKNGICSDLKALIEERIESSAQYENIRDGPLLLDYAASYKNNRYPDQ